MKTTLISAGLLLAGFLIIASLWVLFVVTKMSHELRRTREEQVLYIQSEDSYAKEKIARQKSN